MNSATHLRIGLTSNWYQVQMEKIQRSIEYVLGPNEGLTAAIIDRLTELGVTCESDLIELNVSDLTPSVFLPIPARKQACLLARR